MKKLIRRLTIVFSLLFVFLALFLTNQNSKRLADETINNQQEELAAKAERLSHEFGVASKAVTDGRLTPKQETVLDWSLSQQERGLLLGAQGEHLWRFGQNKEDFQNNQATLLQQAEKQAPVFAVQNVDGGHRDVLQTLVPLKAADGQTGAFILLERDSWQPVSVWQALNRQLVLSFLGVLVIVGLGYYWGQRGYHQRLGTLHQHLANLQAGEDMKPEFSNSWPELTELDVHIHQLSGQLRVQRQIADAEGRRLHVMLNHLVEGVMLVNSERQIELSNRALLNILGLDILTYRTSYEALQQPHLEHLIEKCLETQESYQEEWHLDLDEPKIIQVQIEYLPARLLADRLQGQALVLLYDVTAIQHLEKVRQDFVANASHELKTPITVIQGFADTLRDGGYQEAELTQEISGIISSESHRLTHLLEDILSLSQLDSKGLTLKQEEVQVQPVCEWVVSQYQKQAEEKAIALKLIPPEQKDLVLWAVPGRLEQILSNLVSNALKYTPPGGQVTLAYNLVPSQPTLHLQVKDTGVGIPSEDLPRIFERFYRVSKDRSTDSGGTGLGLAIVKNIVQQMAGRLDVASQFGQGSTFHVYLPLK